MNVSTDSATRAARASAALPDPAGRFTGRDAAIATLHDLARRAEEGRGAMVLITGRAGVGKSALVRQWAGRQVARGTLYLNERFPGYPAYDPFRVFRALLQELHALGLVREPFPEAPETTPSLTALPRLYRLRHQHRRLRHAVIAGLAEASRQRPLLISLEDVHLAPATTWNFLESLARHLPGMRVVFALTLRRQGMEERLDRVPAYARPLAALDRAGLLERLPLTAFTDAEIRQYLYAVFRKADFSSRFLPMLREVTGGVPSALAVLLQRLLAKGLLVENDGVWQDLESLDPESLRRMLMASAAPDAAVFETLTPEQRHLVKVAALFEGPVRPAVLATALDRPPMRVVRDLIALVRRRVLVQMHGQHYSIHSRDLRDAVREQWSAEELETWRVDIATRLAADDGIDPRERLTLTADQQRHLQADPGRLCALGDAATLSLLFDARIEARGYLSAALATRPARPGLWLMNAWMQLESGHPASALDSVEAGRRVLNKDAEGMAFHLETLRGMALASLGKRAEAVRVFRAVSASACGHALHALACFGEGNALLADGEGAAAQRAYREALDLARFSDQPWLAADILQNLGHAAAACGDRESAQAHLHAGVVAWHALGDDEARAALHLAIANEYTRNGERYQALSAYGQCLDIPCSAVSAGALLERAALLARMGDITAAVGDLGRAEGPVARRGDPGEAAELCRVRGIVLWQQGEMGEARRYLEQALHQYDVLGHRPGQAATMAVLAEFCAGIKAGDERTYWEGRLATLLNGAGVTEGKGTPEASTAVPRPATDNERHPGR